MRTQEQFAEIFKQVKWFVNFHKKPVWLVAVHDKYVLSIIKPLPNEIALGTAANLYDINMDIIDTVRNTQNPWS